MKGQNKIKIEKGHGQEERNDSACRLIGPALAVMRTNLSITIHIIGALVNWCLGFEFEQAGFNRKVIQV